MQAINSKKSDRHLLMFILFVAVIGINCFFVEGHPFFNADSTGTMSGWEYLFSFLCVLPINVTFLILAFRHFPIKNNWYLFIPLVFLFFSNVLATSFFPGIYDTGDLVYMPTTSEIARSWINGFVIVTSVYDVLVIAPQVVWGEECFDLFFVGITINALVAVFYSYVVERDLYLEIIRSGSPLGAYVVPQSFLSHRNLYALLMLYGMLAQAYLQCKRPAWWRWAIMLFLFANQFFVLSKTCLLLCVLFLGLFSIYRIAATFKGHKIRNWIEIGIFSAVVITAVCLYFFGKSSLFLPFKNIFKTIFSAFEDSIATRVYNWSDILRKIFGNSHTIVFGFGVTTSTNALLATIYSEVPLAFTPIDNSVIAIWCQWGLNGVVLYGASLVYLLYLVVRLLKKKDATAVVSLLMLLVVLGHGLTEDTNYFGFGSTNVAVLFMVVVPLVSKSYRPLYEKNETQWISGYSSQSISSRNPLQSPLDYARLALFILTPIIAFFMGASALLKAELPARLAFPYGNVASEIGLAFMLFFLPIVCGSLSVLRKRRCWIRYSVLLALCLPSVLVLLLAAWTSREVIMVSVAIALLGMAFILTYFFRVSVSLSNYGYHFLPSLVYLAIVLVVNLGLFYGAPTIMSRYFCLIFLVFDVVVWLALRFLPRNNCFSLLWDCCDYCEEKFAFFRIMIKCKRNRKDLAKATLK